MSASSGTEQSVKTRSACQQGLSCRNIMNFRSPKLGRKERRTSLPIRFLQKDRGAYPMLHAPPSRSPIDNHQLGGEPLSEPTCQSQLSARELITDSPRAHYAVQQVSHSSTDNVSEISASSLLIRSCNSAFSCSRASIRWSLAVVRFSSP